MWKKIWLELTEDLQVVEPIIAEIVDLVTRAGLGDTDAGDIEQLVQAFSESLTNEDLEELAKQGTEDPLDNNDSDTEPKKRTVLQPCREDIAPDKWPRGCLGEQ